MAWKSWISQKYEGAEDLKSFVEISHFGHFRREKIIDSKNSCLFETPLAMVILDQKREKKYPSNLVYNMQYCQLGQNPWNRA